MVNKPWIVAALFLFAFPLFVIGFADTAMGVELLTPFMRIGSFLDEHNGAATAIGTLVVAVFTGTIWLINRRQLKHARDVDRAYVSGGGPGNPPHGPFVLCINNYGRTPATLTAFAVELCEFSAIPAKPKYLVANYKSTRVRSHIYPPGTHGSEVARLPYSLQEPVAYGRFWYEDVWRRPHYASFILALPPRELPANISPEFTDWR